MNADLIREQRNHLQTLPTLTPAQQEWCIWAAERLGEAQATTEAPQVEIPPIAPEPIAVTPRPDIVEFARLQADSWDEYVAEEAGAENFLAWMIAWLWLYTDNCPLISDTIRRVRPHAFSRSYHLLREVRIIASRGIENGILGINCHLQTDWFNIRDPAQQSLAVILDLMTLSGTLKRGTHTPEQGYEYALVEHP